jgi:hypothetical protein
MSFELIPMYQLPFIILLISQRPNLVAVTKETTTNIVEAA